MANTAATGHVTGGFYAPNGQAVVTGTITFTPDAPMHATGADGLTLDAPTSYTLVDGMLPDVELAVVEGVTYRVEFRDIRVGTGRVYLEPIHISIPANGTVRLIDAMPVAPGRGTVVVVDTTAAERAEVAALSAEASAVRAASVVEDLGSSGGLTLELIRSAVLQPHIDAAEPHAAYDQIPDLTVLYRNRKALA